MTSDRIQEVVPVVRDGPAASAAQMDTRLATFSAQFLASCAAKPQVSGLHGDLVDRCGVLVGQVEVNPGEERVMVGEPTRRRLGQRGDLAAQPALARSASAAGSRLPATQMRVRQRMAAIRLRALVRDLMTSR